MKTLFYCFLIVCAALGLGREVLWGSLPGLPAKFSAPSQAPVPAPTGKNGGAQDPDSVADYNAAISDLAMMPARPEGTPPTEDKSAAPNAASPQAATGSALLPNRAPDGMTFARTPAAEIVLRFAQEFHTSIVMAGNGSELITGSTARSGSVAEMLQAVFPADRWQVSNHAGSVLVTEKNTLSFRHISLAELTSP